LNIGDFLKELPGKKLDEKLFLLKYKPHEKSHLVIKDPSKCLLCEKKQCTHICPSKTYEWQEERILISHENCLECGSCRIVCDEFNNIDWQYPPGSFGVTYKYG
jgi:ferredoxin like protein